MFRRARPVRFVYAERYRQSGSTMMRGEQLSHLAAQAMPGRSVRYVPLGTDIRNSMVFLTKGALKSMTMDILLQLKRADNILFFDVVDEEPPPYTREYADVVVAASFTAFLNHSRAYPGLEVQLVNHHVDPRLTLSAPVPPTDHLRAAYFGESINTVLTPTIAEVLDVIHIDTSRENDSGWIERLPEYNLHYAIRATRELDHFKPFLKGFTAAHCNANIVIQSTEVEARHWLGDDYPFLLRGPVTERTILDTLGAIRDSFGDSEWRDGLLRMREVRERTTAARIGGELRHLFSL
jgi:hypothetical protein